MTALTLRGALPALAREAMLGAVTPLPCETVRLEEAQGRVLAESVVATRDQPPFAASAMDGYALKAQDESASLTLIGQSAAGAGFEAVVQPGQCVRIFTGAPVPTGANSVVIQEDVAVDGVQIQVPASPLGQHIRAQGIDFRAGSTLLEHGKILDAISLSFVGATGRDKIAVAQKPVVVLMSGGDEIVSPGAVPGQFDVFDSITIGLSALITKWGGLVVPFAPQRDTLEGLEAGFAAALARADIVVTIGGASVGDRDLMKPALAAFDPVFLIDKVAVRPGKPTWFATTSQGLVLGLPGNPASALVCAHLFLKPILRKLLGLPTPNPIFKAARLTKALPANGPREHYLRAFVDLNATGQAEVTPCEQQDSSLLSVFNAANALLCLPANQAACGIGDLVSFLELERAL